MREVVRHDLLLHVKSIAVLFNFLLLSGKRGTLICLYGA